MPLIISPSKRLHQNLRTLGERVSLARLCILLLDQSAANSSASLRGRSIGRFFL
jgi:hypothetical protein